MNGARRCWKSFLILEAVALGLTSGCITPSSQASESAQMVYSGSWYSYAQWPHDGNQYESPHFIVYSDAASQEARQSVAEISEEALAELTAEFGIDGDELFRFPPGQEKLHIFAYKNRFPEAWGACAYHGGFMIWSLDHTKRPSDLDNYSSVAKHELVHVVELLLTGGEEAGQAPENRVQVWFREGLAEAVTGGTSGGAIGNLRHLDYLTAKYGQLSPIAFKDNEQERVWEENEIPRAGYYFLYPMYQLAAEYLMDADGFGKSPQDLVSIFTDVADGADFPTAFESRMGISLTDYEKQFFDRMKTYLDTGSTPFRSASLVWIVLVAGSLLVLIGSLTRGGGAHWPHLLVWILMTAFFGPFGLLGYLLSRGRPEGQVASWRRALGTSMYSVTGNAAGLVFLFLSFALFLPRRDPTDLALLIPFLVGWLIFRAPFVATRSHRGYLVAAFRSLPAEIISTILVLTGMLSVLVPLSENWWFSLDPKTPLFWGVLSGGALVGTLLVYPYNIWMVRRDSASLVSY